MGDGANVEQKTAEYGLSLEQAMVASLDNWKWCLAIEGYGGDVSQAAQWMLIFSEGIKFACERYLGSDLVKKQGDWPRVDVDNLPEGVGIAYFRNCNVVVVPFWFLKIFEGIDSEQIFCQKNLTDGKLEYEGKAWEFWFITGIQEITHGLDDEIPSIPIAHDAAVSKTEYDAQPHEFKALELSLRAAKENKFSRGLVEILERRLRQAREFQAAKRYSSTAS